MILVGITGIIGSGKTTVSNMLSQEGIPVIDLDRLGKEITDYDEVIRDIEEVFGTEYIANKKVDIVKLRTIAFVDVKTRKKLEAIIHPRVRAELWKKIEHYRDMGARVVVVDAPLLYETGMYKSMDKVVVVSADMDKIRERLKLRGMDEEDTDRRLPHQIPLADKEKMADYILYNNGLEEDLRKELKTLLLRIKEWEVRG
ncbi:MAG TPA: dephospho-CoA kinase [Syntrophorhabdus sp.]|jgi:dephospho-CoA kinase|nr:dephospho-CoA kinase [Syntrophorhabdus sp.]HNQ45802.1 dephospho-CoA kinase [Syntrophorhabdus sp.]HNY69386.1 dephospho-CoA kinase [Syntrophorhabdus sp.]HOH25540.1 dephospho-CoA kinase [Syntrophorhabdus sp.]HPB37772.1 dephospho-CoA kinase [Syntrophorhabdus sp.]